MPSIAVIKADMGHENYGEKSFVFDKSTIDPKADQKNCGNARNTQCQLQKQ